MIFCKILFSSKLCASLIKLMSLCNSCVSKTSDSRAIRIEFTHCTYGRSTRRCVRNNSEIIWRWNKLHCNMSKCVHFMHLILQFALIAVFSKTLTNFSRLKITYSTYIFAHGGFFKYRLINNTRNCVAKIFLTFAIVIFFNDERHYLS